METAFHSLPLGTRVLTSGGQLSSARVERETTVDERDMINAGAEVSWSSQASTTPWLDKMCSSEGQLEKIRDPDSDRVLIIRKGRGTEGPA